MNSIFNFFKAIHEQRSKLKSVEKLEDFPFPTNMISCINKGIFPDLALKLNKDKSTFSGGELIELKDSDSYSVSSFNSTIPTGTKNISQIISGETSRIKRQMEEAGDDINSLPIREVFYLIRGRRNNNVKAVLVHGSFFETITYDELIGKSFSQVFEEMIEQSGIEMPGELKTLLSQVKSEQDNFSKVRDVEKASVKLRFRIMTEVKAEGNILNDEKYSKILDNTLNLIVPKHDETELKVINKKFNSVFSETERKNISSFDIKHHFNGYFRVFQSNID